MEILQAVLLGIVEGLTEFLPISSTGHLIVAERYIGFYDTTKIFTIVIQSGAIAAVIWYYRIDLWQRVRGFFAKKPIALKFWKNLFLAILPAGVLGLLLEAWFEKYATVGVVAVAFIAGGFVLLAVDKERQGKHQKVNLDELTDKQAISIGVAQCLALIPGVSRSGASIVGGLFMGLNRPTATAFSFYMGIPILGLAGLYKLATDYDQLGNVSGGSVGLLAGLVAAFITALLAISWLLRYVSSHNFRPFAYYRIVAGMIVLIAVR